MELLLTVFCVWVFFSLKRTKNRVAQLEDDVSALNLRINATSKDSTEAKTKIISSEPAPEQKPENRVYNAVSDDREEEISVEEIIAKTETKYSTNIPAYNRPDIIKYSSIEEHSKKETEAGQFSGDQPVLPEWLMNSLSGGRLFVTLGLLILFIGVAMLFKYTAHYISIPIELRFIGIALGALGMIYFGNSQIGSRRDYGLYLQGGGLGILFLTVFVAFKFYHLIDPSIAFFLLVSLGLSTFAMSIKHDSMPMAVLAVTGGFLSPILASTGGGSHISLFGYYLLLNLIIFAIAWHKSWRVLNSVGFAFTFVIGMVWGGKYYVPEFYASVQTFLIIYFLLYVGIGVLFASREKPNISMAIDSASIFGVPLIGFTLQLALTKYFPNGHVISCLALGLFYSVSSIILRNSDKEGWKIMGEIFQWLSVVFFTLAIPFAFGAQTTAPLWAMEGVAMLWMLNRSGQRIYGYAGIILLAASDLFLLTTINKHGTGIPFANGFFVSAYIAAISHFFAAYFLDNKKSGMENEDTLSNIASLLGMFLWFAVGFSEIRYFLKPSDPMTAWVVFYSLSALTATFVYQNFAIKLFDKLAPLVIYAIAIFTTIKILGVHHGYHPFMGYDYFAYISALAAHYYWLWSKRGEDSSLGLHHIAGYITITLLAGFELGYYLDKIDYTTPLKAHGWLLASLAGLVLLVIPEQYRKWPISTISEKYQDTASSLLVFWSFVLCLFSFRKLGYLFDFYIPIINIIDMTEILTIVSFIIFYKKAEIGDELKNIILIVTATTGFLFINALMLRSLSYYMGVDYLGQEMFDNIVIQTSITILWTLISMSAMLFSSKRNFRYGWFAGAILLGVVIMKLFTVDLDGVGTISRIISFMGVGLLTIALGYFSPVPAKK